jgi:hypothetical protein
MTNTLVDTAPAFVEMAHQIVWCSAATVDAHRRPRSRILHPIWQWDGHDLVGWIATSPTAIKRAHFKVSPYISINYWSPSQDTCVWDLFLNAPEPLGYEPSIIPAWKSPTSEAFAVLRLEPWRLRVFPGSVFRRQGGAVLNWRE